MNRHLLSFAAIMVALVPLKVQASVIFSDVTPGLTTFSIQPGTYRFTATGASGGTLGSQVSGYGATVQGVFTVSAPELLSILVGGQGLVGTDGGVGGGGGTFIVGPNGTPLLIGGGGGGASHGEDGSNAAGIMEAGGSGGLGGASGYFGGGGGAGGGLSGDGSEGATSTRLGFINPGGQGGFSFLNGGVGGAGGVRSDIPGYGGTGGIGGGGGGGREGGDGGGGGYTGGFGGSGAYGQGRGGTSFDAGDDPSFSLASIFGNGFVDIDSLQPVSPVPLPDAAPMFGAALLTLGAVGYILKRRTAAAA